MERLRSYLIGLGLGLAGMATVAMAGSTISLFTGPQDPSTLLNYLNTLITTMNQQMMSYVTFNNTAGETGEMAFMSPVKVNGTSIYVIMPSGAQRYIQTSATP